MAKKMVKKKAKKPLIRRPKKKPVSPRVVSFKEFPNVMNNFPMIFYPLELLRPNQISDSTRKLVEGLRKRMEGAGYPFGDLFVDRPKTITEVQTVYLEYVRLQQRFKKFPLDERPAREADATRAFYEVVLEPLYELYGFLRKKGCSNKDLSLSWWNVHPRKRK